VNIPQPFTVRQEPTSEDNQRDRDEGRYRAETLKTAKRLNFITALGATVSILGILGIYETLKVTKTAADAAVSQAETARREFQLSQRAWVSLEVSVDDLQFSNDTAMLQTTYKAKNFGHSVATDVIYIPRLIANPNVVLDDICIGIGPENQPLPPEHKVGNIIFPDQSNVGGMPAFIPKDVMLKAAGHALRPGMTTFDLEACLFYKSETDTAWHHTEVAYHVMHKGSYTDEFFGQTVASQLISILIDPNGQRAN